MIFKQRSKKRGLHEETINVFNSRLCVRVDGKKEPQARCRKDCRTGKKDWCAGVRETNSHQKNECREERAVGESTSKGIGDMSNIADKIYNLRKERKLTTVELAKQACISQGYLCELENRYCINPSIRVLSAIADALGVSLEFFLDDDVLEPEEKHLDEAFFRSYQKLDQNSKEQLRKILQTFTGDK